MNFADESVCLLADVIKFVDRLTALCFKASSVVDARELV
jgi:hypothetical protein